MEVANEPKLEDTGLDAIPKFYTSVTDSPYQVRLSNSGESDDAFKIQQRATFELQMNFAGIGTVTHFHNLGYKPVVRGSYIVVNTDSNEFPVGQRGDIPESRELTLGQAFVVSVDRIDTTKLTVSFRSPFAPTVTLGVSGELLLFRERAI